MSTRKHERCWLSIALCCALGACGGEQRDTSETKLPTKLADEPVAEPQPEPTPPRPATPPLPPAPDPPGERAYAHFDAAGQAARAIFEADLAKAAPHLAWLAHHEYPQKLPPAWQPYAARVQLAARVLARASTPGEALRALPALDAACGACHAALAKIDFNATEGPAGHGDGAHRLRDGLAGPADKLFARAAAEVARIKDADKADDAARQALQEGSARAAKATTWVERLAATEQLYGQCGSCHVGLR